MYNSDMSDHSAALKAKIQKQMAGAARFAVSAPRDFLELGPRDAVDKILQRLIGARELCRVASIT
jgi:hypothetical protein